MRRRKVETVWLYKSPQRLAREAEAQAKRQSKAAKSKINERKHQTESVTAQQAVKDAKSAEGASSDSPRLAEDLSKSTEQSPQPSKSKGQTTPQQARESLKDTDSHAPAIKRKQDVLRGAPRRPWEKVFFATLAKTANLTLSARAAGVERSVPLHRKLNNPDFAKRFNAACQEAFDLLEASAWARATHGTERGIWSKDKEGNPVRVETIREYSDRLHEVLLRAKRPQEYLSKIAAELSGPNGAPINPIVAPTCVQIIIPDNGRDPIPVTATVQQSPLKQIEAKTEPAQEQTSQEPSNAS
jgi:hypothetical protein